MLSQSSASTSRARSQHFRPQSRPLLEQYPKKQGKRDRSFQSTWYDAFSWLEYFENVDACFCYPCQMFSKGSTKEKTFVETGFSNWKTAMESGKGLKKHEQSEVHIRAMASWKEKEFREKRGQTVQNLIQVKPEYKIWLKTVFNTTKYLVANGLSFRGHEENTDFDNKMSGGLYLNTFADLLFVQDPHLQEIATKLPSTAKYTSPEIQNEVIETLADIVRETVAKECKEAELFTLMMDGTTDSNHREMEGIALRYWNNCSGGMVEHVLDVKFTDDRTAKGLMDIAKTTLADEHGISLIDGLVSNTFDGASVMSGAKGGLQQLVQQHCGRDIPYIHCLNHRLALVIKDTLSNILELSDFFQLNQDLYNFFKIPQIDKLYEGLTLKKLITTRWDGYFSSLKVISKCLEDISTTLKKCLVSRSVDPEYRAKARGYLSSLKQPVNIFLITFMMDVLSLLNILNKTFQKSDSDLPTSLCILKSVRKQLDGLCEKYTIEHITYLIYPEGIATPDDESSTPSKRKRTIPAQFQDFVLTDKLPCYRDANNDIEMLHALAVEVVNNLNVEFDNRFSEFNTQLWMSFESLKPSNTTFLEGEELKPLLEYVKTIPVVSRKVEELSFDQLKSECDVFRSVIKDFSDRQDRLAELEFQKKKAENDAKGKPTKEPKENKMAQITQFVLTLSGAEIVQQLYLVAVTAGYSSSVVECVFSALNRVDTCHRRRMTPYRKSSLTLLHFENTFTRAITFEQFLMKWNTKPRRLVVTL